MAECLPSMYEAWVQSPVMQNTVMRRREKEEEEENQDPRRLNLLALALVSSVHAAMVVCH